MRRSTIHRTVLVSAVMLFALGATSIAQAQSARSGQPARVSVPKPREEPKATPVTSILTAVLLTAITVSVSLLPSKRGHQD